MFIKFWPLSKSADMAVGELHCEYRYILGCQLGEGTFGVVYKATDKVTNETVAVKTIRRELYPEGTNVTALNVTDLREIKILKELHHPNIIQMLDVYPHQNTHHLVFELMEANLAAVIHNPNIVLSRANYKSFMQMMLTGLAACHKKGILHRDLKPDNLLLGSNGQLKLADFGFASFCRGNCPNEHFGSREVFALPFRSPELLFGAIKYGPEVDIWAAACIFAELILRRQFFQGASENDVLQKIFEAFGTPSEIQWPGMTTLPNYVKFNKHCNAQSFRTLFPHTSVDCLELLQQMFTYDPKRRITAQQALEHRYFRTAPAPTRVHRLRRLLKPEAPRSSKSSNRAGMELKRKRHEGVKRKESEERIQDLVKPVLDDCVEYEVEEVLNSRFVNGKLQYLVRWKGYSVDESTWELVENLENSPERVSAFHRKKPKQAQGMWNILKRSKTVERLVNYFWC